MYSCVHQFHDRRDAGIEVPTALEIVADALDGLVELALNWRADRRERHRRQRLYRLRSRRCRAFLVTQTVDLAQKSLNACDARILPVEIAVGRRGEQAVKARGIGAVAGDHFVRADHIAQALRHFCAVFDHHALGEKDARRVRRS